MISRAAADGSNDVMFVGIVFSAASTNKSLFAADA
jgi:hypothetical protein